MDDIENVIDGELQKSQEHMERRKKFRELLTQQQEIERLVKSIEDEGPEPPMAALVGR